jgi:beta-glucosidase
LLFVGTTIDVEHETLDRKSLKLSGRQEELVKAVFAANPRVVVVEMSAGPLAVPWLKENIPAILQAWWPGEEGGHAVADVLFGDANPAGRLPHTVYASDEQVPPRDQYDISHGFTYMFLRGAPLFPFGHGLSYTEFTYSNVRLSAEAMTADGMLTVSVDVQNTGSRAGDEVAQLHVRKPNSRVKRALQELRGFHRLALKPGEARTVTFTLPAAKVAYWDEATDAFVTEPGEYELLVGASSADIRARSRFTVTTGH